MVGIKIRLRPENPDNILTFLRNNFALTGLVSNNEFLLDDRSLSKSFAYQKFLSVGAQLNLSDNEGATARVLYQSLSEEMKQICLQ